MNKRRFLKSLLGLAGLIPVIRNLPFSKPEYSCVMKFPTTQTTLYSYTWEVPVDVVMIENFSEPKK